MKSFNVQRFNGKSKTPQLLSGIAASDFYAIFYVRGHPTGKPILEGWLICH